MKKEIKVKPLPMLALKELIADSTGSPTGCISSHPDFTL